MNSTSNHKAKRVKINSASIDEIEGLYGIGPSLAQRIIKYRITYGYFQQPEDLANVDGISIDHAISLAQFIDWEIPINDIKGKRIYWDNLLISVIVIITFVWKLTSSSIPRLISSIEYYENGLPGGWVNIFLDSLLLVGALNSLLGFAMIFFHSLTGLGETERLIKKLIPIISILVIVMISYIIGNLIFFNFYSTNRWDDLLVDQKRLTSLFFMFSAAVYLCPLILVVIVPNIVYKPWFFRFSDALLLFYAIANAWSVFVNKDFPIWVLVIVGANGVMFVVFALNSLRNKSSISQEIVAGLAEGKNHKDHETDVWLTWINSRLPNPEQQKALKDSLNKAYPYSRTKTIMNVLVLGAGGWLIVTALSAVIEWVVQNWLNRIFQ